MMVLFAGFFTLGLWLVSLFLPMLSDNPDTSAHFSGADSYGNISGWFVLTQGWAGPMLQPNYWGWYANFPFAVTVVSCLRERRPALPLAVIALLLASSFFYPVQTLLQRAPLFVPNTGFWFWYGAFAFMFIVAFCEKFGKTEAPEPANMANDITETPLNDTETL